MVEPYGPSLIKEKRKRGQNRENGYSNLCIKRGIGLEQVDGNQGSLIGEMREKKKVECDM